MKIRITVALHPSDNARFLVPTRRARRYTQVSRKHDSFRHPGRDCRGPEAMDGNI